MYLQDRMSYHAVDWDLGFPTEISPVEMSAKCDVLQIQLQKLVDKLDISPCAWSDLGTQYVPN